MRMPLNGQQLMELIELVENLNARLASVGKVLQAEAESCLPFSVLSTLKSMQSEIADTLLKLPQENKE